MEYTEMKNEQPETKPDKRGAQVAIKEIVDSLDLDQFDPHEFSRLIDAIEIKYST